MSLKFEKNNTWYYVLINKPCEKIKSEPFYYYEGVFENNKYHYIQDVIMEVPTYHEVKDLRKLKSKTIKLKRLLKKCIEYIPVDSNIRNEIEKEVKCHINVKK